MALVLSGGGARGLAHIGVLRALRDLRVPVDLIVGTSMGSVIGGAYAAGTSVDELERITAAIRWNEVLADRPPRDRLSFNRRAEDIELPSRLEIALGRDGLSLPPAAAGNAMLESSLVGLLPPGQADQPANALALPFAAIASDLLTGQLVASQDTPLALALRASLSVPGLFAPVRVNGRLLVDGGLVRNLPVDVARAMGADVVIAVNLGTQLAPESELGTSIGVAQQMLNILTEQNVQRSLQELGPQDVLVAPALAGLGFMDFAQHRRALAAGVASVQAVATQLARLAVSPQRYAEWEQARRPTAAALPKARRVAGVEVLGVGQVNPKALLAQSGLQPGAMASPEQVREAVDRLYGLAEVARVEVGSEVQGEGLVLRVTEAEWARSRLRLGLELASDFEQDNTFGLVATHVLTPLNAWGAELRTRVRAGTRRALGAEWRQPLGPGSKWFASGSLLWEAYDDDAFDGGRRIARVGSRERQFGWGLGYQPTPWMQLRLRRLQSRLQAEVLVPQDPPLSARVQLHEQSAELVVDTLDPIAYPTRGGYLRADVSRAWLEGLDAIRPLRWTITGMHAFESGRWGGHVWGEWARASSGPAPEALGGFLRLTGTPGGSVTAPVLVFGRLVMARQLGELPAPVGGAVRAGFSVEAGGGLQDRRRVNWRDLSEAASAFVSVDTRFGPVYLGAGATRGGARSVYIFLGPIW